MDIALMALTFADIKFELGALFNMNLLAILLTWILWIALLFLPLSGIDKSDKITHAMYIFVMVGFGFILTIGSFYKLSHFNSITPVLSVGCLMIITAHLRWKSKKNQEAKVAVTTKNRNHDRGAKNNEE